jgi:hypothetical protein
MKPTGSYFHSIPERTVNERNIRTYSLNQSINPSIHQSILQSITHSIIHSINPSINPPIISSINHSINQTMKIWKKGNEEIKSILFRFDDNARIRIRIRTYPH